MADALEIQSNLRQAKAFFTALGKDWRKKFRFVLQKTAKAGRNRARRQIGIAFNTKSANTLRWLQYGVQSTGKVTDSLTAVIWVRGGRDKKSRGFLRIQEYGGTRRSVHARGRIGVPTDRVPRGGGGRIARPHRPKALAKKYQKPKGGTRQRRGRRSAGIFRHGDHVFRREAGTETGKRGAIGRRRARLWYTLRKQTRNRPIFRYYDAISKVLDRELAKQLEAETLQTFNREARKHLGRMTGMKL